MEFFEVSLEAHGHGATLYVAGLLAERAAANIDALIRGLPSHTRMLRVDLTAVVLIDPNAFVLVVRSFNSWRDVAHRNVRIEFPRRSGQARPSSDRDRHTNISPIAVNTASSWPMSTSPG